MTTSSTTMAMDAEIDAPGLQTWLHNQDRPQVIDVRTPAEFSGTRIPDSRNIPLDILQEHGSRVALYLDGPVVLVCQSGRRAEQARQVLAQAGVDSVQVLTGGIQQWQQRGLPVHRDRQVWDLERQVRGVAGGIVVTAMLVGQRVPAARLVATGVGAGLVTAAATNTCAMGSVLSRAPWNRAGGQSVEDILIDLREGR